MIQAGAPFSVYGHFRLKGSQAFLHKRLKASGKLAKFLLLFCSNIPLFKRPTTGFV